MKPTIKIIVYTVLLTSLGASPLIYILQDRLIDSPENLFSYSLGLVAYTSWLLALVLMSRWTGLNKALQKLAPGATLNMHKTLGPVSVVLGLLHYVMSFSMHEDIVYSGVAGGVVILVALGAMWHMKPSLLRKWLHRGALVGILLIWFHVHLIVRVAIITPFMMIFDTYTILALGLYIWHRYLGKKA